jgi:hypothetical protein
MARRLVTVLAAAVLCATAGSAFMASSAFAGGVDGNGFLNAAVYNSTPYTWTLVTAQTIPTATGCQNGCWSGPPAGTLAPGAGSLYQLVYNVSKTAYGSVFFGYDGYFTYQVDVAGGPPEYITVGISQAYSSGFAYGNALPSLQVWDTVAPPPAGYDPAGLKAPGPLTANPQLVVRLNDPTLFDPNISVAGNFTIDASKGQNTPLVELLNAACGQGAVNASCSFTENSLTYGPGPPTAFGPFNSCVGPGGPPNDFQNYATVGYSESRSASLSVGAGVTSSAEVGVFGVVELGASISLDAETQWEDTGTFARASKIYLPANSVGFIWVSPTVGTVTGTLVATIGSATYTATNFSEVRSGVSAPSDPINDPGSAYTVVTKTRPMTPSEMSADCGTQGTGSGVQGTASPRAESPGSKHMPPARLVADRSVAHVALGDAQTTVLRRLGWPTVRSYPLKPCKGMPGCAAVQGLQGNFYYKKLKLTVVFGPNRRVTGLVYRGGLSTSQGVGQDDTMAQLRAAFPRIDCARFASGIDCSVPRASGPVTVFRLGDRLAGPGTDWAVDQVLIYIKQAGKVNG